ncbi:hypothetical protein IQ254_27270 [Nodosilinea sp. LEGE 07088]|uniref:hypothetical protein n=1 Tax=Nodosilinea sp. LEGE 07088 TaxID=2777968 RepID=UPI001880106F|nr:hypothetical protein [Nodosilinea sp. LEGE 07088]MBE9140856.1 hypothetical protein [Nodosilinea sp. LEGE 07088]
MTTATTIPFGTIPLAQQYTPFQLALACFGLLCCGALPSQASPAPGGDPVLDGLSETSPLIVGLEAPTQSPGDQGIAPPPGSFLGQPRSVADKAQTEVGSSRLTRPSPIAPQRDAPLLEPYLTTSEGLVSPSPSAVGPISDSASSRRESIFQPAGSGLAQVDPDDDPDSQDPELGIIQIRSLTEDTDLGILRIRQPPNIPALEPQPQPQIGFLTARIAIANSDNILLAVNDVGGLTGDTFLRPSLSFAVYPSLGPQTVLIGTADIGLQRYVSQSVLNYDDLRFRVGIRQGLTPRSYGQLVFTYQELFRPGGNRNRFFKNTALGLTLGRRDPITPQLVLDSYYLIQFNGSQAARGATSVDFSRIFQSGGAYLGYDITPRLQTGISYQLNLIDYTAQDRYDTFQQVIGQVVYRISPAIRMSIYGGVSFGRSSEPLVQFNDTFVGASIDATIPLF